MRPNLRQATLLLAIALIGIVSLALLLSFTLDTNACLSAGAIACGLITFFFFVAVGPDKSTSPPSDHTLRMAIAAGVVVQYLVLVGFVAFFEVTAGSPAPKFPPIAESLISSFTAIVGVVVAFYFGSSAYIESRSKTSSDRKDSPPSQPAA